MCEMILNVCVDVYVMMGEYFIYETILNIYPYMHTHTHTHMHAHMYVYLFVDLVKHGVFTLVGEILHYKLGRYYYSSCASRQ